MSDESGMYWRKPKKVFAIQVGDILKQPTLDPQKKTHFPAWVRQAFAARLIKSERIDERWRLDVITRTEGRCLAHRTEWLLSDPEDLPQGLSVVDNKRFQENYVRTGEPLTERERNLEEDLREAQGSARRGWEAADRNYPGEPPGRDSMG